jgi:hypothetical protein
MVKTVSPDSMCCEKRGTRNFAENGSYMSPVFAWRPEHINWYCGYAAISAAVGEGHCVYFCREHKPQFSLLLIQRLRSYGFGSAQTCLAMAARWA